MLLKKTEQTRCSNNALLRPDADGVTVWSMTSLETESLMLKTKLVQGENNKSGNLKLIRVDEDEFVYRAGCDKPSLCEERTSPVIK